MSTPCPNHPMRRMLPNAHATNFKHEPIVLKSADDVVRMFEPYNPPGCTVTVRVGMDHESRCDVAASIEAWQAMSGSGRVGVCKHCRMLVFFDMEDLRAYAHTAPREERESE